jgi:hypothetical protein
VLVERLRARGATPRVLSRKPGERRVVGDLAFFDAFPLPGHTWAAYFPPYHEHFVPDVGAYSLAVGVMLGITAWRPEPLLVRTTLIGFLLHSIPHTAFHALPARVPPADAVAQTAGTVALTVVGALLLVLTTSRVRSRSAPRPG